MNISLAITIGFTPEAQSILSNLTMLANGGNSNIEAPTTQAPVQVVPEVQPPVQQAPVSAVPTAQPVQQQPMGQVPPQQVPQPMQQPFVPTQSVPVQQQPPVLQQPIQSVPTSAPSYNPNQLAVAATQLMDSGKQKELLGILAKFGVQALTDLPQDLYGAFATELRQLGAQI